MANTAQAAKRARQNVARNAHNSQLRSRYRTAVKSVRGAADNGDHAAAMQVLQKAFSIIDSIARKGAVHKNKAARHKSRLNKLVKGLVSPSAA
jgi:small subunit ribosomal protein S20